MLMARFDTVLVMRELDLPAAAAVLRSGVTDGVWPGAVAAVGVGDDLLDSWVLGAAEDWPGGRRAMTRDTVFDVASLTKVLATAPAVLLAADRGLIDLDETVARWLPAVDDRVRVRHLLTHTSGLPASVNMRHVSSAQELVRSASGVRLDRPPDERVRYSDVGFILLGGLVEAATGDPLDTHCAREVFAPLGQRATFAPPADWRPRIAATEIVDGAPVHGRVHDENAAAAQGRVGHAGVFATLDDVVVAARMWLTPGRLLADRTRREALRDHTPTLGGHRGLGWTCRGDGFDILSDGWGPAAVSHTGFTGTSVALDPVSGRWAVLLTNAVHYGRGRNEVFAQRRRFHAALVGD